MLTKSSRFFIRLHPAHKPDTRKAAKRAARASQTRPKHSSGSRGSGVGAVVASLSSAAALPIWR